MPTPREIERYKQDPAAFLSSLVIKAARGFAKFGDVMAPHQREWIAALGPAVVAVARGEEPPTTRFWLEASKGCAKDTTLAAIVLWLLAFSGRPTRTIVGAADRDQANELARAARDFLTFNPWLAKGIKAKNFELVCAATRAEAEIVAADIAGSHGSRPDLLILNELTHVERWEYIENLADNASKMPHGVMVVATNAGFTGTEAWKWREIARASDRWFFHVYDKPAPWLDPAELVEAERRNSQSRFRRLFFGQWSSGAGDALDEEDIKAAIDPALGPMVNAGCLPAPSKPRNPCLPKMVYEPADAPPPKPQPVQERFAYSFSCGVDLGVKHDHSAVCVLASDHRTQRVRLALALSWAPDKKTGKVDLEQVEASIADLHTRFGFVTCLYDPFQAALMAQRLTRRGVPMKELAFVGSQLNLMATTLLEVFRSRRIDLYPHERLVSDLRRLTIEEKSYGHRLTATRDADGHADLATAMVIALPTAVELAAQPYGPGMSIQLAFDPRVSTLGGISHGSIAFKEQRQEPYGGWNSGRS